MLIKQGMKLAIGYESIHEMLVSQGYYLETWSWDGNPRTLMEAGLSLETRMRGQRYLDKVEDVIVLPRNLAFRGNRGSEIPENDTFHVAYFKPKSK